jgi:predicted transcriptional regulator
MTTTRQKTTVYLDPELRRATKMLAASTGRHEYEIVEDALRQYLGNLRVSESRDALRSLLDRFAGRSDVEEEEALAVAYSELHQARAARRRA